MPARHAPDEVRAAAPAPAVPPAPELAVAFGTDETTPLTRAVVARLEGAGHRVAVVADGSDWPDAGRAVGEAVASGQADRGVVCCTTGTGVSIAANKVPGVRAALCTDAATAAGARRWNDANVLAFGLRLSTEAVVGEMLDAFLGTAVDPGEGAMVARVEPAGPAAGAGPAPR
ncbi:MAG: RpiB/LacA/LacB family sugar-phosphate isomerase [Acidimicrobiales bacterium]